MVLFDELRISDEKDRICVECHVDELPLYNGMHIERAIVYNYRNSNSSGLPISEDVAYVAFDNSIRHDNPRRIRFYVTPGMFNKSAFDKDNFDSEMFFVKIECDGVLPPEASLCACGMDNTVDIGIVLDWKRVYETGMGEVARMSAKCADPCNAPLGHEHFLMTWFALKLALSTGDYNQIKKMWEAFLRLTNSGMVSSSTYSRGCNCS